MSQGGNDRPTSGGGGSGITTLAGDTGTATGSTVNVIADVADLNSGSTVEVVGDNAATLTLNVTDLNGNTIVGRGSGNSSISGSQNTVFGSNSLTRLTSGNTNLALGYNTGSAYTGTESSNILLNTTGLPGDQNTMRIGQGTGTGPGQLISTSISGIGGINIGSTANVVTESADQLGTAVITAGAGITITPSANVITISSTASPSSLSVVRQVFTTSGTYTPTVGMTYCLVELVGGGGGGAGSDINDSNPLFVSGGSGGGSGGYCNKVFPAATIGASQAVVIGAGGVALPGSGTGNNGTNTTFGALMTGAGGNGGVSAPPFYYGNFSDGGDGGTATGGDYNIVGQQGGQGIGFSMATPSVPLIASFTYAQSSQGGSNPLGFGGGSVSAFSSGQNGIGGLDATGYGSGGSSAACTFNALSTAESGGNGANGIVIITEYVAALPLVITSWVVVTTNTSMSVNTGYIANAVTILDLRMPTTAPVGSLIEVCGINAAGGWSVVLNGGQSIIYGTSSATTSITSTQSSDTLRMVCTIANTEFIVLSGDGNPTIV